MRERMSCFQETAKDNEADRENVGRDELPKSSQRRTQNEREVPSSDTADDEGLF